MQQTTAPAYSYGIFFHINSMEYKMVFWPAPEGNTWLTAGPQLSETLHKLKN